MTRRASVPATSGAGIFFLSFDGAIAYVAFMRTIGVMLGIIGGVAAALAAPPPLTFESGHVRPLAYLEAADLLFAVNTPAARLTIFRPGTSGLTPVGDVAVGLEPIAVAARVAGGGQVHVWVVNHLSDSVSIVEVDPDAPDAARVVQTLLVGDEPADVVFAGTDGGRAFVTAAHRGQNRPGDAQPLVPGVGRADVWVFDADAPGDVLGGTPLTILTLFGDSPRALAASPDGSTVHAAVFHSGNGTTTLSSAVTAGPMGPPPLPPGSVPGALEMGLIVKRDPLSGRWEDELGRDWAASVPFGLPDLDVFTIDADAPTPAVLGAVAGVGTTLYALAVRPDTGTVYVANTEARNHVRFEPVIRGHLTEARVTVIDGGLVTPVHLNPHIDYGTVPGPPSEIAESLAIPLGMTFSADGQRLFLAAMGSGAVAMLDTGALEAGSAAPRVQIAVGAGPTGVVLDAARDRLYVMNRLDQTVSVVSGASTPLPVTTATVDVGWDPTPASINAGRRFLYDARGTSAHGDAACASCHTFGDVDHLAWDLGDPFGEMLTVANPTQNRFGAIGVGVTYHPVKGPMLTQSLRGLEGTGPMHWRGERSAAVGGGDPSDARGALATFDVAFPGLLGGPELATDDFAAFSDFVLSLRYPPNPNRPLDDQPTPAMARGEEIFRTKTVDGAGACNTCHVLPLGTNGHIGVVGSFPVKVPHLRNVYAKVGRFGLTANDHALAPYTVGDQVRGFGLEFNGSLASVLDFVGNPFLLNTTERQDVSAFVLAFDTGLAPGVGQQVTLGPTTAADAASLARIALLSQRHDARDCDLVVAGRLGGVPRAWLQSTAGFFVSDRLTDGTVAATALRTDAAIAGQERTYTCVPPRTGIRVLDRDGDGPTDAEEIAAGSDPLDAGSVPSGFTRHVIRASSLVMRDRTRPPANPAARKVVFKSKTRSDPAANRIVPPAPGSAGDPRTAGARIALYNGDDGADAFLVDLDPALWRIKGSPSAPRGWLWKAVDKNAPIQAITVAPDLLLIKGGKAGLGYSLDEDSQGRIALRLRLGTAVEWCAATTGLKDQIDQFKGVQALAAACPDL